MVVRELVTRLGFDADESKVKSFNGAVVSLTKGLAVLVGAATAAGAAAFKLANDTAKYGDEAAKTARVLGTTAEELQANRFAFDRAGVSASEFTTAMEYMTRQTEYTADQLPMLLDELAAMESANERAARAQELFGRSGIRMGTALAGGSAELASLTEEYRLLGGGISDADAATSEQFTDTMTNLGTVLEGLRLQIGARLMPVVMDVVDAFMQFVIANREIINSGLDRFFSVAIGILRTFFKIIRTGFRVMDSFAQFLGGWENTIRLIAFGIGGLIGLKLAAWLWAAFKAVRALNFAMMLNPAFWLAAAIGAAIAAVVLLADDLYNFWIGNDSLIGAGIEKWGEFVERVKGLFTELGEYFRGIMNSAIDAVVQRFESFKNAVMFWRDGDVGAGLAPVTQTPGQILDRRNEGLASRSSQLNTNVELNITTPPGTTAEQVEYINRTVNRSLSQQIRDAALTLETR